MGVEVDAHDGLGDMNVVVVGKNDDNDEGEEGAKEKGEAVVEEGPSRTEADLA